MSVRTAHSLASGEGDVAREIRGALAPIEPTVVLYFAGGERDPKALASAMQIAFPGALVVGCTTAGELEGATWRRGSVVAMGLAEDVVRDASAAVIERLAEKPSREQMLSALAPLASHAGAPLSELDPHRYVGLLLVDGLSMAEEDLMDRLGDLTEIPIVGGSAGDDLAFRSTWVCKDGQAYRDAALLLLLEPAVAFRVLKTQSFRPLDRVLRVTHADVSNRVVHAFDGEPAAARYAEALGISKDDLPGHFTQHPLGLMVGDEPFVRSPQQLRGDSVVFYCNVAEGVSLTVLESTDVVEDTRRALVSACEELGGASAVIDFDCVLRALEIQATGRTEDYGKIFEGAPTVGFCTYGEQFLGHINQTATMLLLGRS